MSNSDSAPVAASDSQVARSPANTVATFSLQIGMMTAVRAVRSMGACGARSTRLWRSPRSSTQAPISAVAKPGAQPGEQQRDEQRLQPPHGRQARPVRRATATAWRRWSAPPPAPAACAGAAARRPATGAEGDHTAGKCMPGHSANSSPREKPNQGWACIGARLIGGAVAARALAVHGGCHGFTPGQGHRPRFLKAACLPGAAAAATRPAAAGRCARSRPSRASRRARRSDRHWRAGPRCALPLSTASTLAPSGRPAGWGRRSPHATAAAGRWRRRHEAVATPCLLHARQSVPGRCRASSARARPCRWARPAPAGARAPSRRRCCRGSRPACRTAAARPGPAPSRRAARPRRWAGAGSAPRGPRSC